jgi:ribonuclease J
MLDYEYVHTSGHATVEDLRKFVSALKPRTVIPIHTIFPNEYHNLSTNVHVLKNGEKLPIN